jgi:vitamin B12 transporter
LDESEVVGEEPVQPSDSEREKEADAADGEEDAAASDQSEDAEDAASTGAPENEAPVGVSLPELISRVEADYPPEAAAQGLEAKVILELTIDVDGRVLDATVREPAGHGFDEAARKAALGFRFKPARRGEEAVKVRILYEYGFRLAPSEGRPKAAPAPRAAHGRGPRVSAESPAEVPAVAEVVVRGVNEAQELRESGYPVTVIEPDKFASRAMSVGDLLERVPGVKIRRSGGLGSATRISVRGLEGRRVQIYINGSPLNAPDGSFAIDDIPLHVIERIEVYKGVVPARFGGDGLGGAVNIVIKEFPPDYADVSYSIASYNQHKGHVLAKTHLEELGIELGVGTFAQYGENDYRMPLPNGGSFRRDHDRFKQLLLASVAKFTKTYFDELEVELVYVNSTKEIQGIPGFTGDSELPTRNVRAAYTWNRVYLLAAHAKKHDFLVPKLDLVQGFLLPYLESGLVDTATAVYDFDGTSFPSPSGEGEVGSGPNDSNNARLGARHRMNLAYELAPEVSLNLNNHLDYASNHPEDDVADAAASFPVTPRPGNLFSSITGLSVELSLFDERWLSVAGLKHFFYSSEGFETSQYPGANLFVPPDPIRHDHHGYGANFATRFKITEPLLIKASYERGQRMPTEDEIFGDGFLVKTSPDLKPERSDNYVAGVYYEDDFGEGNTEVTVKVESDVFHMHVQDMIRLGGFLTQTYENVDEVKIWGNDGEVQLTLTRHLYTYFNWTYQDVRNDADKVPGTTQSNFLKGKRIPNLAPYFFNWGAELSFFDVFEHWAAPTEFALFYDGRHVAEFLYDYEVSRNQRRRVPSTTTHDVGVQLSFDRKRYTLSGSIINVTDQPTYDLFNQPLPGQVFKLAVRGTFY